MVLCATVVEKPLWGDLGSYRKRVPLTYDAVLGAFDDALALDDWPHNDTAIRYALEDTESDMTSCQCDCNLPMTSQQIQVNGKKRLRDESEDEAEFRNADLQPDTQDSPRMAPSSTKRQKQRSDSPHRLLTTRSTATVSPAPVRMV
ncbi:hypothetical protein ONZ51_g1132 [Trametes cubensis]|uniref:Uncharacterized protein n=1 Tax=Trametes cubensis TaxID=1111947 RepID=A0AAD7U211_9APHY|nr:hypothetical protein ONZ51_g1132 [Trametes cubensis]